LVVAQRHALLAEQRKIPLDPAIIQQAYQTRERIETLSPEAQEIYQRLQQVGSTQRSNPAPQVDVPAAQPDVVVDQPKTASNSAAQPRS
jgi:hypothetical protein